MTMINLEHLSYSSVDLFIMCARAWRFRYVDKVVTLKSPNLIFGSAVHEAVEVYIRLLATDPSMPPLPIHELWPDVWAHQLELKGDKTAWDKPPEEYEKLGLAMLSKEVTVTGGGPERKMDNASAFLNGVKPMMDTGVFLVPFEPMGEPVLEQYVEFTVPGVPIPIVGYIDIITDDGIPADFKSAGRAWKTDKAHDSLQPAFYLAALNQTGYQGSPDFKFRYYIFTKSMRAPKIQIIETKRTVGQLFWLADTIREVWEAIQTGKFPPTGPGHWLCSERYCDYWSLCRGKV